ncbi:MAG: hypothetical protein WAK17_12825 [Candidatus Nitrosopolaris sp.]
MTIELKKENVAYIHMVEGESSQIPKDLDTMITIVDEKTRALEPMLIICYDII